jgi:hypothetical protein
MFQKTMENTDFEKCLVSQIGQKKDYVKYSTTYTINHAKRCLENLKNKKK